MKRKAKRFAYEAAAVLFFLAAFPQAIAGQEGDPAVQEEESSGQTPQEMNLFLIPMGRDGIQKGEFWIYTEVYGEDGKTLQEEDWTLTAEITGTVTEQTLDAQLVQADNGAGYFYSSVTLTPVTESGETIEKSEDARISVNDYSAYQMTVNLQRQDEMLWSDTENVPNSIQKWPELRTDKWEASDEEADQSPAIVYDWEDMDLFGRIFTVTLDQVPKSLKAEEQENGIWEIHALKDMDTDLQITVKDLAGNTETSSYHVKINTGSTEISYKMLLFGVVIIALVLVLLVKLKGRTSNIPSGGGEEISIRGQQESLEEVYRGLKRTAEMLKEKQERYRELLEEDSAFAAYRTQEASDPTIDYRKATESYEQALRKLEDYQADAQKYAAEWKLPETKQYFSQVIRTMGDQKNEFSERERELDVKIQELMERRRNRETQKSQMKRYLGKELHLTIRTRDQEYSLNKDKIDQGFELDDCRPLIIGKNYEVSSRTMAEIFGESSGIRFYSDADHRLWMECEYRNVFRVQEFPAADQSAVERELCENGIGKEFRWRTGNGDEVTITVETEA